MNPTLTHALIPENAPFEGEQRLWLNGYMAGLFAAQALRQASPVGETRDTKPGIPLVILYGSQTGTAEGLARRIATAAKGRGGDPKVVDAAAHVSVDWTKESHLLVVTSTYGDGEMPDNAQGFWEWLQGDGGSALAHLHYSVLALGDTAYEAFCEAGRKIDERLAALGAARIAPRVDCDVDYETPAKEWIDTVLAGFGGPGAVPEPATSSAPKLSGHGKDNPFPARLLTNRKLTAEGSAKEIRHVEISLEGSGLAYDAGDALGVWPVNCTEAVAELLAVLGHSGDETVDGLPWREALVSRYDFAKLSPELLQQAAVHCEPLREMLAPEKKTDLQAWLSGRELIDVLLAAPGFRPSAVDLAGMLRKLAPRLYSISSSPKAHAGQVHLTVGIVRYETHGRKRKGVCSTFLADRAAEVPVRVFVQTSHGFRLPSDGTVPVIMVGPGTGIAPFRAFLHERKAVGAAGKNWLFFGDQKAATDFSYRDELEAMRADGHLTKLSTAFSRDQAEKLYVQHRMKEEAAELWEWLQAGAHFYVCGDASRMAKDVDAALHEAAETAGGLSREAAADYVKQLKAQKRYQRDVY